MVHARCCHCLATGAAFAEFTATEQHSLQKQPRGQRRKQAEMTVADLSLHSEKSTNASINKTKLKCLISECGHKQSTKVCGKNNHNSLVDGHEPSTYK